MNVRISLILAFLAGLAATGCDRPPSRAIPSSDQAAAAPKAYAVVDVPTTRVRRGPISERISAPGSLVARRESHIGTEVAGRLLHVYVSEGDRVEAGAPLFQIDPASYEMTLRRAEAGLEMAQAERSQLQSDLERGRTLRRKDVMAQQDFDRLTTQLAVAEARERQAQEAVALARHQVGRTTVCAPYAGSIASRLADEGTTALVQPQTIVVVIQETGELEAHAAIPESQLALVQVGDHALLHVEGIPDPIETAVSAVNDTIDPTTRTYLVKMRVPNAERQLKAGVFAHVEIIPRGKADVLLVPPGAIRTEDGITRLLVVRDEQVVAVPIEVGLASEDAVEVLRGVADGDEIIVGEAARTIAPGMRVRAVPAREGAAG